MQMQSKVAITRLQALKSNLIGHSSTIDSAVETIIELDKQVTNANESLKKMNQQWLDAIAINAEYEDEITKLKADLELYKK